LVLSFGAAGSVLGWLVQVVHRRDPRASRSVLTSDEAARVGGCLFAHLGKLLVMPVLAGSVRSPVP